VGSTLYRLVAGQADPSIRMPHGQAALSDEDVTTIAAWIDQGAKN
jgi:cytochrome c553